MPSRVTPGTRAFHWSSACWPNATTEASAFALAERRKHAAREPRRVAAELTRSLEERDLRAALDERRGAAQSCDTCAYDERANSLDAASPSASRPNHCEARRAIPQRRGDQFVETLATSSRRKRHSHST